MFGGRERKNSAYRSVRYSTIRKQSFTADVDRLTHHRIGKNKLDLQQSTFYNTRTLELKNPTSLIPGQSERIPYLESFHSMFSSERDVRQGRTQPLKTTGQLKVTFKNFDENYNQDKAMEFTLLDPFNRPYTYLDKEVKKCEKQLANDQQNLKCLRSDLGILKHKITGQINSIEEYGKNELKRLRNLLKKNETQQQEGKMRVRREITQLFEQHDNNIRLRDELLNRSRDMQTDIFSCQPFELQILVEAQ